jgi:hypothetical protein
LPPGTGAALAAYLDRWWTELGRPDPYVVADVSAGDGSLAAEVLAARPACETALRYVAVEADPAQRAAQATRLALEPPASVLGRSEVEDPDEPPEPVRGQGPLVTALAELPAIEPAVVVAAGWLSRLPSDRVQWRAGRWWELRLAAADDGGLDELALPLDDTWVDRLVPSPRPDGARYDVHVQAKAWLAGRRAERVAVVDRIVASTQPVVAEGVLAFDQLEAVRPSVGRDEGTFSPLVLVAW